MVDDNGFRHSHNACGDTKSEAKQNARDAVFSILENSGIGFDRTRVSIDITPPDVDATISAGKLTEFTIDDPVDVNGNGDRKTFTTDEIPQNVAVWLFEVDCCFDPTLSEKYELVSGMLKVWGIFRGGDDQESVMELHNMEQYVFDAIVDRKWTEITITVNEDSEILHWDVIID